MQNICDWRVDRNSFYICSPKGRSPSKWGHNVPWTCAELLEIVGSCPPHCTNKLNKDFSTSMASSAKPLKILNATPAKSSSSSAFPSTSHKSGPGGGSSQNGNSSTIPNTSDITSPHELIGFVISFFIAWDHLRWTAEAGLGGQPPRKPGQQVRRHDRAVYRPK